MSLHAHPIYTHRMIQIFVTLGETPALRGSNIAQWRGAISNAPMKTLLLVEDNPDNADLIRDLVGDSYRMLVFPDGPTALAALAEEIHPLPDLLLLDISLPGMDGKTLLRQIRAQERLKNIPAIALTAHAMKSDKETL